MANESPFWKNEFFIMLRHLPECDARPLLRPIPRVRATQRRHQRDDRDAIRTGDVTPVCIPCSDANVVSKVDNGDLK
jgi:hypothetical protein